MLEIPGFESFVFTHGRFKHGVYRRGAGPGVILCHELSGLTRPTIRLGERVAAAGFAVYLPLFFGRPGEDAAGRNLLHLCLSREFRLLATRRSSPAADWVRGLAMHVYEECGGPGVGLIGMCLTGNFALALMADPLVMAPVASQPALPLGLTSRHRRALGVSPADLEAARERTAEGGRLLGLRFRDDPLCPALRFVRLREELGEGFEPLEIPGSAHSVLTRELVDEEGHPTHEALEKVLGFLEDRLRHAGP